MKITQTYALTPTFAMVSTIEVLEVHHQNHHMYTSLSILKILFSLMQQVSPMVVISSPLLQTSLVHQEGLIKTSI